MVLPGASTLLPEPLESFAFGLSAEGLVANGEAEEKMGTQALTVITHNQIKVRKNKKHIRSQTQYPRL